MTEFDNLDLAELGEFDNLDLTELDNLDLGDPTESEPVEPSKPTKLNFTDVFPNIMSVIIKLKNYPNMTESQLLSVVTPNVVNVSVYNNYGRKDYPDDPVWNDKILMDKLKTAAKGKKKSNRLTYGEGEFSGTSFNSQTTFVLRETDEMMQNRINYYKTIPSVLRKEASSKIERKYFKVKFFINGSVQIPGIIYEDLSDSIAVTSLLLDVLEMHNQVRPEIVSVQSSMRNYNVSLISNVSFDLLSIQNELNKIPNMSMPVPGIYMNRVDFNLEKYKGLIVYLYKRPDNYTEDLFLEHLNVAKFRKTITEITVKIFENGGKINIDSVSSKNEAISVLEWLKSYLVPAGTIATEDKSEYYSSDEFL